MPGQNDQQTEGLYVILARQTKNKLLIQASPNPTLTQSVHFGPGVGLGEG